MSAKLCQIIVYFEFSYPFWNKKIFPVINATKFEKEDESNPSFSAPQKEMSLSLVRFSYEA
jgi:hypothetical protein